MRNARDGHRRTHSPARRPTLVPAVHQQKVSATESKPPSEDGTRRTTTPTKDTSRHPTATVAGVLADAPSAHLGVRAVVDRLLLLCGQVQLLGRARPVPQDPAQLLRGVTDEAVKVDGEFELHAPILAAGCTPLALGSR